MAGGDQRKGKEPAEDKFPEGMRVLAVEVDPACRRVLKSLLRSCKYNPTMVTDARTALEMLREGGKEQFDLVIADADVHMPDMDGFKLLELIGLEMDLPVIMISVNGETETMLKGRTHGASDYLVKPVHIDELKNIWQHVIRKKPGVLNQNSSDSDDDDDTVPPVIVDGEKGGAKRKKCSKKKKHNGEGSEEKNESTSVSTTRKKPRVSWTAELHGRFLEVVNLLGVDKAVPKTILQMMNVDNLTRESVGSHLQKHRLFLKRFADDPRMSNTLSDSFERRNSPCYMRHDVSWLPDTRSHYTSVPPVNSFTNISSDGTMLDTFPPSHSSKAYASILREKLLEASIVEASSHPDNSSFAEMPNGELFEPVNQLPVQPAELVSQSNAEPSRVGAHRDAQFPHHGVSSSNPMRNVAPSSFHVHTNGTPLAQTHENLPLLNQLPSFGASPGQMPMFQNEHENQMVGINNNNNNNNNATSVDAFIEQMTPALNMAINTAPIEMRSGNVSSMIQMVNAGSTSSPLPNLQTGSSAAPPTQMVNSGSISPDLPAHQDSSATLAQMLNPGDASGFFPVQEGPVDQQALDDQQPNYTSPYFPEDNFTSLLNEQDFNDDAFFAGGC